MIVNLCIVTLVVKKRKRFIIIVTVVVATAASAAAAALVKVGKGQNFQYSKPRMWESERENGSVEPPAQHRKFDGRIIIFGRLTQFNSIQITFHIYKFMNMCISCHVRASIRKLLQIFIKLEAKDLIVSVLYRSIVTHQLIQ